MPDKNRVRTTAIVESKGDEVIFRGTDTLDDTIRRYDESITKMNDYIQSACQSELDAMKLAQTNLERKMKEVMGHKKLKTMEENAQIQGDEMNTQMRRMQRELQRMEDDIYDDRGLSERDRQQKMHSLHKAAISQYKDFSERYPSAMRAQLLSNMRLLN